MSDAMDDLLPQGNRLQILSPEEYELLWGLPQFTMSERRLFFALTRREQDRYERLRTRRTKVHFLLHLGYFKARQRFYVIDINLMSEDIAYLSQRYFVWTTQRRGKTSGRCFGGIPAARHTAGMAAH